MFFGGESLKFGGGAEQQQERHAIMIGFSILILLVTQFPTSVYGIPINANSANNRNNYNENHANRPLPPQPPVSSPVQRPVVTGGASSPPPYPQQTSQNQGPEMEDFGRLHTNQKQFRRHAMVPPEVKPTAPFQPPVEKFAQQNRYNGFDESPSQQQQPFHTRVKRQPPTTEDAAADLQPGQVPTSPPSSPTSIPKHFHQQQQQQMLNDNVIFHQHHHHPERMSDFPPHLRRHPSSSRHPPPQQQQQKMPNSFTDSSARTQVPITSNTAATTPRSFPFPGAVSPTAVAIVVPGGVPGGGNSTLFIEYDVSDNDVTYETIVEVEEQPDSVFISNHVSPV